MTSSTMTDNYLYKIWRYRIYFYSVLCPFHPLVRVSNSVKSEVGPACMQGGLLRRGLLNPQSNTSAQIAVFGQEQWIQ
jgi:hypothetical protein